MVSTTIKTESSKETNFSMRMAAGSASKVLAFISPFYDTFSICPKFPTVPKWAYENNVILDFSRPGKPTDNAFIESFDGSFRDECLNVNWFLSLEDAKEKISAFKKEYNHFRPHSALGNLTPVEALSRHPKSPETLL